MYYEIFAILLVSMITLAAFLPRPALSSTSPTGVAIPLYTYPTDGTWAQVIQVHNAHPSVPIIAVINPNSGPGTSVDPNYVTGIQNMQTSGIIVLGYVATGYATSSYSAISNMEAQVNAYNSWYHVNGIMFDEMSNVAGHESYYSSLNTYVKSLGMTYTMGNPGTTTLTSYYGILDSLIIAENAGYPTLSTLSSASAGYSKSGFGYVAYGVPLDTVFETSSMASVGWLYITNLGGGNPYNALPSYFLQEVAILDVGGTTTTSTTTATTSTSTSTTTTTTTTTTVTTTTTTTATTSTAASSAAITVLSVGLTGAQLAGMLTVIKQGSTTVYSGYTPITYTGVVGQQYTVTVANHKTDLFAHWEDGATNPTRTITLTQNTVLTAYYKTAVSLTVKSATLSGQAFSGMRVVIKSGGSTVKSGYTPLTYTAESGTTYTVTASSSSNHVFDHWNDGTTNPTRTITTSTQNVVLIAYYKS